jgi:peptide/nickel transport system permease protein
MRPKITDSPLPIPDIAPGDEPITHGEVQVFVASHWKLMWWRFRRHKLALVSGAVVSFIYLIALFCEFLAPSDPNVFRAEYKYAPPQHLHIIDTHDGLDVGLYVYGYKSEVDPVALRRTFVIDEEQKIPVGLVVKGHSYKLFGLISTKIHLFGPKASGQPLYILGADRLGRDLLSRLIYGTRISMSIGLVGVVISLILGIIIGGVSGYYGGWIDDTIQRIIEFIRSLPTIPLWLGLSAALPLSWSALKVYFAITVILSFIGWTSLARVVRGRFLSLREEDFVMAAQLDGASEWTVMFKHMLPAFYSHIIASITLAIPGMILAETALSFLGLGLRPPVISWGVLLQDAQSVRAVATAPWLLWPAVAVVIAVLSLNFLGDGLRDAADPYTR